MKYKDNGMLQCIKQLCDQVNKENIIILPKNSSMRAMLNEWHALKLSNPQQNDEEYFPFKRILEVFSN